LFCFYIETASFGVSVEPKLTEINRKKPVLLPELPLDVPLKLLTSTVTDNFDRGHTIFYKIVGASWLKKDIRSQKLLSLKYYSKCKKIRWLLLFILLTFPYVGFSLSKIAFKNAF
jgi:hypothetical protein